MQQQYLLINIIKIYISAQFTKTYALYFETMFDTVHRHRQACHFIRSLHI